MHRPKPPTSPEGKYYARKILKRPRKQERDNEGELAAMATEPDADIQSITLAPLCTNEENEDTLGASISQTSHAVDLHSATQTPQRPVAEADTLPFVRRPFFFALKGSPVRALAHHIPWEEDTLDDHQINVEVSIHRLKLNDLDPEFDCMSSRKYLSEKRRIAWGFAQIAQSGKAAEEELFAYGGAARSFTLRPLTRSDVPLQWVHIGPGAIPDALADLSCERITIFEILHHLNDALGTSAAWWTPGLVQLLDRIRRSSRDFGEVYGKVRGWWAKMPWHQNPPKAMLRAIDRYESFLQRRQKEDIRRSNATLLDKVTIKDPVMPPRRVWDLYSNRILPYSIVEGVNKHSKHMPYIKVPDSLYEQLWTVSHGWVAAKDRKDVQTPVNGYRWPVPIPKATTLDHVRVELLNLGAEYVWLDVLCLRQCGRAEDEAVRTEEWKVDVPTIGYVYRGDPNDRPCVTYYNGLGLPLNINVNTLASERHWRNRVWTVQETLQSFLPGGLTGLPATSDTAAFFSQINSLLRHLPDNSSHLIPLSGVTVSDALIHELKTRSCTREQDRVSCLTYFLAPRTLPIFEADADIESAWHRLIRHASEQWRLRLMYEYAIDTPFALFPSWQTYIHTQPIFRMESWDLLMHDDFDTEEQKGRGDTVQPGRYWHGGMLLGECRVVGPSSGTAGDKISPQLEAHISIGSLPMTVPVVPRHVHGVLLEGVKYTLILVEDEEAYHPNRLSGVAAVEIITEFAADEGESYKIEVIKWAVLKPDWPQLKEYIGYNLTPWLTTDMISQIRFPPVRGRISYVCGEEALRRTAFKAQYLEAFDRMIREGKAFVTSQ